MDVAVYVGEKLAGGFVGGAGSMAFGEILSLAGADISGKAEINAKLDEIIDQINQLQQSVNKLTDFLGKQLSQLEYDLALQPVLKMIDTNTTLARLFNDTLSMKAPADIARVVDEAVELIDREYLGAVETWNNALVGVANKTSLIKSWGVSVYKNHSSVFTGSIFGLNEAQAIQSQWDYFDAQQALSVMYLIEYQNKKGLKPTAMRIFNDWQNNRKVQLSLLYANITPSYNVYSLSSDSSSKYTMKAEQVSVASFPVNSIVVGDLLWSRNLIGPSLQGTFMKLSGDPYPEGFDNINYKWTNGGDIPPYPMYVPDLPTIKDVFWRIGAKIGGDGDHFEGAIAAAGFKRTSPSQPFRIWFFEKHQVSDGGPSGPYLCGYFIDNDNWCRNAQDWSGATAEIMLYHHLTPAERQKIFGGIDR